MSYFVFSSSTLRRVRRYLLASTLTLAGTLVPVAAQAFTLNLLHFSDGESSLLTRTAANTVPPTIPPTPFDYSGVALFADLIDRQRNLSDTDFDLLVTAGDNFLAGPQFEASLRLPAGAKFYDAIALDLFNIDVGGIGNHEFDFGPDVLARFIDPTGSGTPFRTFVSANLDIPDSSPLKGLIQPSTIVTKTVNGVEERVGVIGATTPLLRSISSPGNVQAVGDTAANPGFQILIDRIQAEVDALEAQGVDKIVLVSHLQDISEEKILASRVRGVDIIVAAGSDTRLANPDDPLLPLAGEVAVPSYPLIYDSATGAQVSSLAEVTGEPVLLVSADGEYKYLGNLQVEFTDGKISSILDASGPKRNTDLDGLTPRADLVSQVQEPVAAFITQLQATVIGTTEVPLDSIRTNVRARSTFAGSLIADSIRDAARDGAIAQGLDASNILVGIQNGGGIRNDRRFAPGDNITAFDTFDVLPFSNFVTIVKDVTGAELLSILERAVSSQTAPNVGGGGQFLQLSGLEVVYDVTQLPQVVTAAGEITRLGSRIQSIFLAPENDRVGQFIYDVSRGGFQLPSDQVLFDLATIDFTARGGDNFAAFANMPDDRKIILGGVTYQKALENYIIEDLLGVVTAAAIPNGEGIRVRDISAMVAGPVDEVIIVQPIPEPTTIAGVLLAGAGFLQARRRTKKA